jgi:hypothetical protein
MQKGEFFRQPRPSVTHGRNKNCLKERITRVPELIPYMGTARKKRNGMKFLGRFIL